MKAFVDESYVPGLFVLGMLLAAGDDESARDGLREALRRAQRRPHFAKERPAERLRWAKVVSTLGRPLVVVIRTAPDEPMERSRGRCVAALPFELGDDVTDVVFEARERKQNLHDAAVLTGIASYGPALGFEFLAAADEPLLWAADIVAGSLLQARARSDGSFLDALGPARIIEL
ncbi:MAG: hypothetical protein M3R63_26260 [Actinomycetota bacterium]|nr:hypothetical protein [Actinomycetota bacterium]